MNVIIDILIILFVSGLITGIYTSLRQIINTYHISSSYISILGYSVSFIGFFLILLLTLTITSYVGRYNTLQELVLKDSENLMILVKLLHQLENTQPILDTIETYTRLIIQKIDSGIDIIDTDTSNLYDQINTELLEYVKKNDTPFNQEIISKLKTTEAVTENLYDKDNAYLYHMAIFFSLLTLGAFLFLGIPDMKIQFAIDFILISVIIASLYIIYVYSKPFGTTSVSIDSQTYQDVLDLIQKYKSY